MGVLAVQPCITILPLVGGGVYVEYFVWLCCFSYLTGADHGKYARGHCVMFSLSVQVSDWLER